MGATRDTKKDHPFAKSRVTNCGRVSEYPNKHRHGDFSTVRLHSTVYQYMNRENLGIEPTTGSSDGSTSESASNSESEAAEDEEEDEV